MKVIITHSSIYVLVHTNHNGSAVLIKTDSGEGQVMFGVSRENQDIFKKVTGFKQSDSNKKETDCFDKDGNLLLSIEQQRFEVGWKLFSKKSISSTIIEIKEVADLQEALQVQRPPETLGQALAKAMKNPREWDQD